MTMLLLGMIERYTQSLQLRIAVHLLHDSQCDVIVVDDVVLLSPFARNHDSQAGILNVQLDFSARNHWDWLLHVGDSLVSRDDFEV